MKKIYTCPMVEVNAFDIEDVVMLSGIVEDMSGENTGLNDIKGAFKANVSTATSGKGIVVEW